jgi:hypothetical protein
MSQQIFNRSHLYWNKTRCVKNFAQHNFLHKIAADNLCDFFTLNQKQFKNILIWGGRGFFNIKNALYVDLAGNVDVIADIELSPFKENSFDLVISFMNLQTTNDLPGALVQIRKTMQKDGLFKAFMFGGATLIELRQSLMQAEIELTGSVASRVFPFADVKDYGMLLQRAGFEMPVATSETHKVSYNDIVELMQDLRGMGEGNCMFNRQFLSRDILARADEIYKEQYSDGEGGILASFEIIELAGIK